MSARIARTLALLLTPLVLLSTAASARAERLDWEPDEEPAGVVVTVLRNKRDGLLGLVDDALDLQLALFSEASLLGASALMLASDAVGLVDDNPVTEHVTCAVVSKSIARTAYLLHVAGAEAVLGSHGLDREEYLGESMAQVNPLIDPDDAGRALPLHPLDFLEEGWFHARPLTVRMPGALALSALVADGVVRPIGSIARFFDLTGVADALERRGNDLVTSTVP